MSNICIQEYDRISLFVEIFKKNQTTGLPVYTSGFELSQGSQSFSRKSPPLSWYVEELFCDIFRPFSNSHRPTLDLGYKGNVSVDGSLHIFETLEVGSTKQANSQTLL